MTDFEFKEKSEIKIQPPKQYAVIILNDDYTPDTFVIRVLQHVFQKTLEDALTIMTKAHSTGKALAGIFSKEIAETKANAVRELASREEFPLNVALEEE